MMALSTRDKLKIVTLLGWPANTVIAGKTNFNSLINDRLSNLDPEIERLYRDFVDRVVSLDEKLEKALKRAAVQRVGDITLNADEIRIIRKERCRVLRELSESSDVADLHCGSMGNISI